MNFYGEPLSVLRLRSGQAAKYPACARTLSVLRLRSGQAAEASISENKNQLRLCSKAKTIATDIKILWIVPWSLRRVHTERSRSAQRPIQATHKTRTPVEIFDRRRLLCLLFFVGPQRFHFCFHFYSALAVLLRNLETFFVHRGALLVFKRGQR